MSVKKSSGKWRVRVRAADGTQASKVCDTKAEADKWERDYLSARDKGHEFDPQAGRVSFKDYAEAWRVIQNHRPSSARAVERNLRLHVYPTFGQRRLNSIRPSEVQAWYAGLTLAPKSKAVVYGWLSVVFKAAVRDRILTISPCTIKIPRKLGKPPLVALTVEQIDSIIENLHPRYQAVAAVACQTGLRLSEVLGLTIENVNFLGREIRVTQQLTGIDHGKPEFGPPKTDAGYRTVPVTAETVNILSAQLQTYGRGPGGLIFTSTTGSPCTASSVSHRFAEAVEKVEGVTATFHDLRHHYASVLIAQGCNVKQIQRVLGHETAAMTLDTYGHLFPNDDEDIRKAVERARTVEEEGQEDVG